MKKVFTTKCPNCKKEQELYNNIDRLMKSRKKSIASFECDNCAYFSAIIIDGKDIFYKNSEIKKV